MSARKDKTTTFTSSTNPFESRADKNFLASHSFSNIAKGGSVTHSSYYLFDDDGGDITLMGRNISEYVAPSNSASHPKENK